MDTVLMDTPLMQSAVLPQTSLAPQRKAASEKVAPEKTGPDLLSWANLVFGRINKRFERGEASDVLAWASETFGSGLSIGTSFGTSGLVMMDLALRQNPEVDIFYIDTGFFF